MPNLPANPEDLTLAEARAFCLEHLPGNIANAFPADMFEPSRRRGGRPVSTPKIVVLTERELIHTVNTETYFFHKWNGPSDDVPIPNGVTNPIMVNCDSLDAIDWSVYGENDTVMCFDPDHNFILARVAARSCSELRGERGSMLNQLREVFRVAGFVKPNIRRGRGRGGTQTAYYKCWGWRKAYDGLLISEYVYLADANPLAVEFVDNALKGYVKVAQGMLRRVLNRLVNFHWMMHLANFIKLPSFTDGKRKDGQSGFFTQVSLACGGYWSNLHTDTDFMYTMLSVLAACASRDHEVLYYFAFPLWGVSVPLMSGQMIVFDSNTPHCSSNARTVNDYIFSCYISAKTVAYAMLEKVQSMMKSDREAMNNL